MGQETLSERSLQAFDCGPLVGFEMRFGHVLLGTCCALDEDFATGCGTEFLASHVVLMIDFVDLLTSADCQTSLSVEETCPGQEILRERRLSSRGSCPPLRHW